MSSAAIKIKLRNGNREFEAEGPRADIEALLERWWKTKSTAETEDDPTEEDEEPLGRSKPPQSAKKKGPKRKSNNSPATASSKGNSQFDVTGLTNRLKNDPKLNAISPRAETLTN